MTTLEPERDSSDGAARIERKRRAFAVLRDALDVDEQARDDAIARWCLDDPVLRADVRNLLAQHHGGVLERDVFAVAARLERADEGAAAGAFFGAWRVVSQLGEGGMGAVYLAERGGDGYLQRGALKLIKRGMDSADLIARFRRERQILARLSHPAIAALLDGGIADDGRPFLVMEYVEGETLPAWSRRVDATLDQRIALFLQLCDAVAHAHHRLIVHRDIKPNNVMVDAADRLKLLDFGIAKVLEDTAQAERTATASRLLSRAYAAPEQSGDGAVTTATDIYQLGALLFELLSGTRLHELDGVHAAHVPQRLALARSRAGTDGPRTIAARDLDGDPGIILNRATDADPARRYATVEALADDLRRWRSGRPISARADSTGYRLRRFLARNRVAVAAAVLVALAIIGGSAIALWQARRAGHEARAASEQAQTAERVKRFMVTLFSAPDPAIARGGMPRADELLANGAARIASELADEPRIQAELYEAMGNSYAGLGRFDAAADLYSRGATALEHVASGEPLLARLQRLNASAQAELGQYPQSLASLDAAEATWQRSLGPDPREQARIAMVRGWVLRDLGRLAESETILRSTLARLAPDGRTLDAFSASVLNNLAYTLQLADQRDASLAAFERLSAWTAAHLQVDDPQRLWASWSHARALREFGDAQRARDLLVAIRPAMLKVVGADHPDAAGLDIVLGQAEMDLGQLAAGHARIAGAVARSHAATRRNQLWAQAEFAFADAEWRMGRLDAARTHFTLARAVWRALVGEDHPSIRDCDSYLAAIDARSGTVPGAQARLAALVELRRARAEPGLKLSLALQSTSARAAGAVLQRPAPSHDD